MSTDSINFNIRTSTILTMLVSMHTFTYNIHDLMHNMHMTIGSLPNQVSISARSKQK